MIDIPKPLLRAREKWRYRGSERPDFAVQPGPGQESVWDYPRPPQVEPDDRRVQVFYGDTAVADSRRPLRVLETAGAPVFYLPPADVEMRFLEPSDHRTICEWKGYASHWSLRIGDTCLKDVAWSYPEPFSGYEAMADYLSFYPSRLDCRVGGERVEPQPGGFYGGWVTSEIVGPIKGEPGTESW